MELLILLPLALLGLIGGSEAETSFGTSNIPDDAERLTDDDDAVDLSSGYNTVAGGAGDDQIVGGDGFDQLYGQAGDDTLTGDAGKDLLVGGADDDSLDGGAWFDALFGDDGDDTLNGDAGGDFISGGSGDDDLTGGAGDDVLEGGAGQDRLDGGSGDDVLAGFSGFANLTPDIYLEARGQTSDPQDLFLDRTFVGETNDAADTLIGGSGNDLLLMGAGDMAEGGTGFDDFVAGDWLAGAAPAVINDFDPDEDVIVVFLDGGPAEAETLSIEDNGASSAVLLDGTTLVTLEGRFPGIETRDDLLFYADYA